MTDDLVERVALRDKAVLRYQLNKHAYRDVVDAAIAVALEEAVQLLAQREDLMNAVQFRHAAAAIRALIPKEPA